MKSIYLFISLFIFSMFNVHAQYQLTGTVKEAAGGAPVPYATATVLRSDSTAVTGAMTGEDGKFFIANVAAGDYIVQVSFIGYEKAYRRVNVPAQSDLGEISLAESATRLNEVVVNATRPLIENRADRYVVNVSGNLQSAGRDALDVLRNTPGLLVNHKGDISLMGNGVQVWIDGRPSRMSGEQLQAFLNSMQGGEIDRIEIVTNPSSRYDAEGGGGIVDIRTKKGLQYGVNGTLTAGHRQGYTSRENAGLSMNWRREKFNIFGNYSFNTQKDWERLQQVTAVQAPEGEVTRLQNVNVNSREAHLHHSVRAGMDYFINPNNIFGVIVNAYHFGNGLSNAKSNTDISPADHGVSYTLADNNMNLKRAGAQINMNYQSTFANTGKQLNVDLDYAHFYSDPFQTNANSYFDSDGGMIGAIEQFSIANPQKIDVYSAKIDYKQPLWKDAMMETGAKFGQSKTDNDLKYEKFIGDVWQPDAVRSNRFAYTEQISAVYVNLSQKLGKFSLQAGLRGEYTSAEGDQKTTNEVNDTTYFNLFPTFFVNYQASPKHNFGLSYSRRLSRPDFESLNPFELVADPYFYRTGNPYLTPAYTHNVQFSHMFGQSLMTRIAYSHTSDMIIFTLAEDAATQRTCMTYRNFGRSQNISAMVNYRRQVVKIWTANLTVQGAYVINTSDEVSGEFDNNGYVLMAQLNNSITVTPTLSAEITGMYMSKMRQGYAVMQPQGNLSVGLRQMLLKGKMSLSLTVNDILYTSKTRLKFENINNTFYDRTDSRYANLTLRYNFGSKTVRAARNKSTGIEDEAWRAGGR